MSHTNAVMWRRIGRTDYADQLGQLNPKRQYRQELCSHIGSFAEAGLPVWTLLPPFAFLSTLPGDLRLFD